MREPLEIKGRVIGQGRPLVCVPIMAENRDKIVEEARRLVGLHTEMIEWRVDAFSGANSLNAIREVLAELEPLVKDTILVYTFRSKKQGGLLALEPEQIRDIREVAAESGVPDFIDVEIFEEKKPEKEIKKLQAMGTRVIASHHDFHETPEQGVIHMLLEQIYISGADVVKLALMPQTMRDVWKLMEETSRFHEHYPDQPLITMSMGTMGVISRIAGEFVGSCVTFGAGEKSSAPGQLPMDELEEVLHILHKSVENETDSLVDE